MGPAPDNLAATNRLRTSIAAGALLVLAACGEGSVSTATGQATSTTAAAPTTVTTAVAVTTTTAPRCSNVSFSANAEDVATEIRATGLACSDAEALVRKVGAQANAVESPPKVEADGYTCLRTSVRSGDHGPPLGSFECTSGAAKVTFLRALVG